MDDVGELVEIGGTHIPGYLYLTIEDGKEKWKYVPCPIKGVYKNEK